MCRRIDVCLFVCAAVMSRPIHSHIHSHMVAACLLLFMIQIAVLANTLLRMVAACLRAFMVQIAVLANHENGRDSHIRQIKIFGPRLDPTGDTFTSSTPTTHLHPEHMIYSTS